MNHQLAKTFVMTTLSVFLVACGGGGSSSSNSTDVDDNGNTTSDLFSVKGANWSFTSDATAAQCYDIDSQAAISCNDANWDIKAEMNRGTPSFYTNGGTSGSGQGAVLYSPFSATWADLSTLTNATQMGGDTIPSTAWTTDSYSNAFTEKEANQIAGFMEYDLFGEHKLSPNFKTYLVSTDTENKSTIGTAESPVYAVQVYNYYNQTGTSGYISLRYINTLYPDDVRTIDYVNATNGWAYVDLAAGVATNSASNNWQLAFNRYTVQTNGSIGSAVAAQPAGFYDDNGAPIVAAFKSTTVFADTLETLKTAATSLPSVRSWSSNAVSSLLNPAYQGSYPQLLNFGWYNYYPTAEVAATVGLKQHMVKANSEAASIIRGNTGNSYARIHLKSIDYADINDYSSVATWNFELDIQPE